MFLRTYLRAALLTTFNLILFALTGGRYLSLEGRLRRGAFHNWYHRVSFRPGNFARPQSEEEIVALVKSANRLRVCGSGHSFNNGLVTDATLVSLDRYTGIIWVDPDTKQMAVRAGMRIRDINRALLRRGWAFAALPTHDAQSIGGIISTDVHGTGRDWGFVSQSVVQLKLVDGRGEVHVCLPTDPLFQAAIGGIGAVGIIIEVVIQAVDAFNVLQKSEMVDLDDVEATLDQLIASNDHLSLFVFPFSRRCRLNTWNRTDRPQTAFGMLHELIDHSLDALGTVWLADMLAHLKLLPRLSDFFLRRLGSSERVLESSQGFNRTVYYVHHELEFAVPYKETFPVLRRFLSLYEDQYSLGRPFVAFELRFTPAGHERTLLGAGQGRQSMWLDLLCNDSAGSEPFLEAAEQLAQSLGARPHLGKYCGTVDRRYLAQVYGDRFNRFCQLVAEHDPNDKFVNAFTHKLFK